MPEPATCSLLRTAQELQALRPQWEGLWRADQQATPFQSPAWLLPWWDQFGEGPLRAVAIYRNGALRGLLPFYLYTEPSDGYRKLFPLGIATSDYLDGVFAPECRDEDIVHALECLTGGNDWDSLEVAQLRPGSRLAHALQRWRPDSVLPGCGERVSHLDAVPITQLPSKIRRNTMYYRNRAARLGALELTVADADDWLEAFDALERLHTARWNLSGQTGVLADPRVRAWHHDAIPQLLAEDLVAMYCLRINRDIIATLYTLADPEERPSRSLYIYLTGFSHEHAELRPGSVLLSLVIDQAAQQGFTTLDMLRGNEPYKDLWHPRWIAIDAFRAERRAIARELVA